MADGSQRPDLALRGGSEGGRLSSRPSVEDLRMARRWSFEEACTVAGDIYGNILARNSDDAGFKYTVARLNSGSETVREIVKRFCTSEEFREKYVMNQAPNELAKKLLLRFVKNKRPDPATIKIVAVALVERDWRQVVEEMIESQAYGEAYGEDQVPLWA